MNITPSYQRFLEIDPISCIISSKNRAKGNLFLGNILAAQSVKIL
jgi:hypothetical protein